MLRDLAPAVFDPDTPLPLAIGVDRQIVELGLTSKEAGDILRWWTLRHEYRAAVARGGRRHNLDGSLAGELTAEHQAEATQRRRRRYG